MLFDGAAVAVVAFYVRKAVFPLNGGLTILLKTFTDHKSAVYRRPLESAFSSHYELKAYYCSSSSRIKIPIQLRGTKTSTSVIMEKENDQGQSPNSKGSLGCTGLEPAAEDNPLSKMSELSFSSSDSETEAKPVPESSFARLKKQNEENIKLWKEVHKSGTTKVPYPKPKIIRSRNLVDASAVFQCNAWDDVEWDEEMIKQATERINTHAKTKMDEEKKKKLEDEASKFWEDFYGVHKNKFFRDRNWLFSEFSELESPYGPSVDPKEACDKLVELRLNESYPGENSKFKVLEVGCGVGNTVFPLLSSNNNPHTYVYCCDFSSHAVELVKKHATFEPARCTPFVLDITEENPTTPFPENSIDVLTAIFVVSAISPAKFQQVIKNFHRFLKPGGLVLFRDYGRYDLAQLRFKDGRCIEENFYMRGDGTRVYFFTEEEVETLFRNEGFEKHALLVDKRLQVNRGKQLKMYRIWVQGKFRKV